MVKSFQDGLAPDPSYAGTRDAYIRQASATTAHGLETTLQVDGDDPPGSGNDMNILLAWDVSAIPAGAVVIDAGIELQVTNPSSGGYTCYALQRGWIEAETTWNQAAAATPWETPGAAGGTDRGGTALCTVTAGAVGPLTVPLNAAGIAAVQAWVDNPADNHGLLIGNPATTDGADFHARESGDAMSRPRLNITYSVVAPPPNEAPIANFAFACTDLACTFTDASTDADGTIQNWSWDFGHDGQTSSAQNPPHAFPAAGDYTVTLTVTDDDGATDGVSQPVTVTAANEAPTASFTHGCTDLDCSFTDTSTDSDGTVVSWSWDFGDGSTSTAQNPSHSYASGGSYTVSLTVTDDDGATEADLSGAGTVSGTYADTHGDDEGGVQSITERESGGKKNERYSYLSHTWRFTVVPGSAVTLYVNAWSGGSSDGDDFRFAWSSDNVSFDDLFTVSSTSPANVQSVAIPASGTIYLRVTDTDQGAGNKGLDTVFVDQLYIRSDGGEPPANQPPVAAFTSDCGGLTCGFTDTSSDVDGSVVAWSWDFGDGATSTAQHPSHAYSVAGGYTVTLIVTDDDGATAEASSPVTATEPSPISLSASGYKVRGEHTVDLSWSGAAGVNVEIERDGGALTTTANDGAYTDNTGNKGGRTYRYRVCETGAGSCSNEVTVVF
jgi:PKD repeat protein